MPDIPVFPYTTQYIVGLLDDVDAAAARSTLGVVIGTDVQAYSARLGEIAALAVTDSNIIVGNGSAWVAESGATARTSLGLGTANDVQFHETGICMAPNSLDALAVDCNNSTEGIGVYGLAGTFANIRTQIVDGLNSGGMLSLGGSQFIAQGANNASAGSGSMHFLTSSANSANSSTDATLQQAMSFNYTGDCGYRTTTFPSANGGAVLGFGDNTNQPTYTRPCIYAKGTELYTADGSGNETLQTPHSQTAPEWLYDNDEHEQVDESANNRLGIVVYTNNTRRDRLVEEIMGGRTPPTDPLKKQFRFIETFAEHNQRLGLTGTPQERVIVDHDEAEQAAVDERAAWIAAWERDKAAFDAKTAEWNRLSRDYDATLAAWEQRPLNRLMEAKPKKLEIPEPQFRGGERPAEYVKQALPERVDRLVKSRKGASK